MEITEAQYRRVDYEDHRPVRVDTVVIGAQHDPDISHGSIRDAVVEHVNGPNLSKE